MCPLRLAYFTQHSALRVHPRGGLCQNFLLFYVNNIPLCVYTTCGLFIHKPLGCCHVLAVVNYAVTNTGLQTSLQDPAFNSFGIYPEMKLLGHMVIPLLICFGTRILCLTVAVSAYDPANSTQRFSFSTSHQHWSSVFLRQPTWWVRAVVSCSGLHFPDEWCGASFHVPNVLTLHICWGNVLVPTLLLNVHLS